MIARDSSERNLLSIEFEKAREKLEGVKAGIGHKSGPEKEEEP